jgi:hypothetical protein
MVYMFEDMEYIESILKFIKETEVGNKIIGKD